MAAQVAAAYNEIIRGVPHCYPIRVADWATVVGGEGIEDEGGGSLRAQRAFVAMEAGSILGYAHLAVGAVEGEDPTERGLIRFLWYMPGHRAAGQELLDASESYLSEQGTSRVMAFPHRYRYRFYYLPSAYLSDRLGHIAALLGANGYRRERGEVYMDWPDYEPMEPLPAEVQADLSMEWVPGRGRKPGLIVRAHQGSREVGTCYCTSCAEYADADAAQEWCFTKWLWVEEDLQGKGLGRHLLQRALREMHGVGYRHAAISNALYNYRAALFYTNLGYRVVDWTYGYGRELGRQGERRGL
jgi:GNAT superfamily N-acetyltransferase